MDSENLNPKLEGTMDFDFFNEDQFKLLDSKLINKIEFKGNFHLPNGKIGVCGVIIEASRRPTPKNLFVKFGNRDEKHDDPTLNFNAFGRASLLITKLLNSKTWVLYGHVNSVLKRNIFIILIPGLIASYSFMRENETLDIDSRLN